MNRDKSSTDEIQSILEQAHGQWVSAKDLAAVRIEYKRPIWQIRHERHVNVANRTHRVNGKTHGYYRIPRYEGEPDPPLPGQSSAPIPKPAQREFAPVSAGTMMQFEMGYRR